MGAGRGYGRVGGRRSSAVVWQWMIIGVTLGLACSAVLVLTLLTVGILNLEGSGLGVAAQPTQTPAPTVNVQATVDLAIRQTLDAMPTNTPMPAPTDPPAQPAVVQPPTATATSAVVDLPTATQPPTATTAAPAQPDAPEATTETSAAGQATTVQAQLPPGLLPSRLLEVIGGTFQMGTTPQEIAVAVRECLERDGGQCQESYAQDSIPVHQATINSFFIEEFEVTNVQYIAFLNSMGPNSHLTGCGGRKCIDTTIENAGSYIRFDSANYTIIQNVFNEFPAAGVTWFGAQAYCQALGRRLPTEAEWERAARGVNNFLYPWGTDWQVGLARYRLPSDDPTTVGPAAVGSFTNASEFGAFDMAGNVAEWVQDFYSPTYYSQPAAAQPNPQGPPSGTTRVKRGGSWDTLPFFLRSVHRQDIAPDSTLLSQGFRCAADNNPAAQAQTQAEAVSPIQPISAATEVPLGAAPTVPPRLDSVTLPATPTPQTGAVPPGAPGGG